MACRVLPAMFSGFTGLTCNVSDTDVWKCHSCLIRAKPSYASAELDLDPLALNERPPFDFDGVWNEPIKLQLFYSYIDICSYCNINRWSDYFCPDGTTRY